MAAAGQRTRPGRRLGDRAERGGTRRGSAWRGRGRARGGGAGRAPGVSLGVDPPGLGSRCTCSGLHLCTVNSL